MAGFPRKFLCMMSVKAFGPESEVCMVKNGSHPLCICLGLWGCARPGGGRGGEWERRPDFRMLGLVPGSWVSRCRFACPLGPPRPCTFIPLSPGEAYMCVHLEAASFESARDSMVKLANEFIAGTVEAAGLYQRRDELVAAFKAALLRMHVPGSSHIRPRESQGQPPSVGSRIRGCCFGHAYLHVLRGARSQWRG